MGVEAGLHERLDSAPSCARQDKRSQTKGAGIDERALIHSVVLSLKFNVEARLAADSVTVTGYPEPGTATTSTLQNGTETGEQHLKGALGLRCPRRFVPSRLRLETIVYNSHPSHSPAHTLSTR